MTKANSMTISIVVSSCFVFAFVLSPIHRAAENKFYFFLHLYLLAILSLIVYFLPNTGDLWFKLACLWGFQAIYICFPLTVVLFTVKRSSFRNVMYCVLCSIRQNWLKKIPPKQMCLMPPLILFTGWKMKKWWKVAFSFLELFCSE